LKILCFIDFYLPGYKAGGPIKTLASMVENLGELEFNIVTRDRDLNDKNSYLSILINQWISNGRAKIFYASPDALTFRNIKNIIKETPHDAIYLNSFFSWTMTLLPIAITAIFSSF